MTAIRQELKVAVDPAYKKGSQVIYKGDQSRTAHGVRVPVAKKIAAKYFPEVKSLPKKEFFSLVESFWATDYVEEALIATNWVWRRRRELVAADLAVFDRWVKKYVNNWPKCDDFVTHCVGYLFEQYPALMKQTLVWAKSKKRFVKRAAAVGLIMPLRHRQKINTHLVCVDYNCRQKSVLTHVFQVAEILLEDPDDLVQKGYGWLLKVAADFYQDEVFVFVMKHKTKMPRTALRYAVEKMLADLKKQAMKA